LLDILLILLNFSKEKKRSLRNTNIRSGLIAINLPNQLQILLIPLYTPLLKLYTPPKLNNLLFIRLQNIPILILGLLNDLRQHQIVTRKMVVLGQDAQVA
jgi:hypothetical protein